MKPDRVTFIKILLLALAILVESPTLAQADIIATPKTVTINAVKGETITRTISLRVAQDTKDVKVIALDAFSADNTVVLPAKAIQITAPPTQINADRLTTFPLTLNLQSVPSGEFTGEILLTSLISFTVLAGGGFDRLYASKSTFGANGWSDYFSLLVLGFGAEATRNVVTQVAGKKET